MSLEFESRGATGSQRSVLAEHWGLVLGYGLLTLALGLVLLLWPDETLSVLAFLIGLHLLLAGAFRLVTAATARSLDGGIRIMVALSGVLSVLVGLLCMRSPLQTVLVLSLVLGGWWLVSGVIDIIAAFQPNHAGHRGWDIAHGAVSAVTGLVLLTYPELSLGFLVVVAVVWLLVGGAVAVATALRIRREAIPAPVVAPQPS